MSSSSWSGTKERAAAAKSQTALPDHLDAQYGAIAEPLACAVHGVRRLGPVSGEPAVVIGAGTMGLLMLQLLLHAGAGPVTVVDLLDSAAVDPRPLLSEPLPLEGFGEPVDRVRGGQGIKWHIRPS
jgi:hypothetical protein